ncbi:MAG: polyphosphate kinase 2 [Chitinophagales bacterium]|nr:polyphosphate kinase 2 [Bacteroidota bacterium]MCB9042970.1 polyphosphate kinase 2 [Chitinophagales bacterium]
MELSEKELNLINSKRGLEGLLLEDKIDVKKTIKYVKYEKRMEKLQEELLKLQKWVVAEGKKVVIIFEGRDAAGKGGAIRRITEHLNPREYKVVALPKPDEIEIGQWYFQRYVNHLPQKGEIVFFDRSWYNRAIVEPVNGFCTQEQYEIFMSQVNEFEKMMLDSGIYLLKMYFSISKKEQEKRFKEIINDPLKKWKYSAVDSKALELWDAYTFYKEKMFERTAKSVKWKIIKANRKTDARITALEYILQKIPYVVKDEEAVKHHNVNKED